MKRILVVGIGSVVRGDDGIGVRVVDELLKEGLPPSVEVRSGDISGLDILKYFPNRDRIIIIDAAQMREAPGCVRIFHIDQIHNGVFADALSTHGIGLRETLAIAKQLETTPRDIRIIGVQPKDISYRLQLTDTIAKVVPAILDEVKGLMYN